VRDDQMQRHSATSLFAAHSWDRAILFLSGKGWRKMN
jgi:hypothetical protein